MFADRVKETTTTTGTGAITLAGAFSGQFLTFTTRFAVNAPLIYAIVGQSGTEWEVGEGYLSGASTLVRDRVTASSNADALVNFSAGTKDVFDDVSAEFLTQVPTLGEVVAMISGAAMP
jgi:hypothetical protein